MKQRAFSSTRNGPAWACSLGYSRPHISRAAALTGVPDVLSASSSVIVRFPVSGSANRFEETRPFTSALNVEVIFPRVVKWLSARARMRPSITLLRIVAAAAERKSDAGAPALAPFAPDHIAFENIVLAAAFEKCAIAYAVALRLGEIRDKVCFGDPVTGGHDIQWGHGIGRLAGSVIHENVVRNVPPHPEIGDVRRLPSARR